MANIYQTRIECISNEQLLKYFDPDKIIQTTSSEFLYRFGNELVFETRSETVHQDILSLSEKFPHEIFHVRFYDMVGLADGNPPGLIFKYKNGIEHFLGYEPKYIHNIPEELIIEFGEDVFFRLWKRIRRYLIRLDIYKQYFLDDELKCDPIEHHFDDSVSSTISIHAEYDNYKIIVDKVSNNTLICKGYKRNTSSDNWEEIILPDNG
jgi:hypothetical protein